MSMRRRLQALLLAAILPLAVLLALAADGDWRRLLVIALVSLMAFAAASVIGRHLVERPLRELEQTVQRRAAGDAAARFPEGPPSSELGRIGAALNAMAGSLERLVEQKTELVHEVQHRIMNSLHLLGAILHLHARQVDDESARRYLDEARERVASLSVVYRQLSGADSARVVDFGVMLRGLCDDTLHPDSGREPAIKIETMAIDLPTDTAMNLALIAHELLTKALKHAQSGRGGRLRVALRKDGDRLELTVACGGRGVPAELAEPGGGLGLLVIQSLTRQVRGRFTSQSRSDGIRFAVTVPLSGHPADDHAEDQHEKLVA